LAGFTQGRASDRIPVGDPLRKLWTNSGVGGVLWDLDIPVIEGRLE
jgi:hypothetical protein